VNQNQDDGWITVVTRRKQSVDTRSVLLWAVHHDVSIRILSKVLKDLKPESIQWRGRQVKRHVCITFCNAGERNLAESGCGDICRRYGWRMVRSRSYNKRRFQRQAARYNFCSGKCEEGKLDRFGHCGCTPPRTQSFNRCRFALLETSSDEDTASESDVTLSPVAGPPTEMVKALKSTNLRMATINVQGGIKNKIGELETHFNKRRLDVVAVQEHNLKDAEKSLVARGFRTFGNPIPNSKGGVAFLVAEYLAPITHKTKDKDPGQLWIRIAGSANETDLYLCAAHMPQESESLEMRRTGWETLSAAVRKYSKLGEVALLLDANARIGAPTNPTEAIYIGKELTEARTSNGKLFAELLCGTGLYCLNGQFPPTDQDETGFTRMDGKTLAGSCLDYIAVSKPLFGAKAQFAVDYTNLSSDHHLVVAECPCPMKIGRSKRQNKRRKKFNVGKLVPKTQLDEDVEVAKEHQTEYERQLLVEFEDYEPDKVGTGEATQVASDFVGRMERALESSVGSSIICRKFSRRWYDKEVKQSVKTRREAYNRLRSAPSEANWSEYKKRRKESQQLISDKKTAEWETFLASIDEAQSTDLKRFWNLVHKFMPKGTKVSAQPIKRKNGTLAVSEEQICNAWADHQEKLFTPRPNPAFCQSFANDVNYEVEGLTEASLYESDGDIDGEFTTQEIKKILDSRKLGKGAGLDGTTNEMLKCGGVTMVNQLQKLCNWLRSEEKWPDDWRKSVIFNLYKKGDMTDPNNYRGISLISCLGKFYTALWANRLTSFYENVLADEQGGFRPRRSTVDQVLILHDVLLRRKRQKLNTYAFFVDFRKAFDTVWHEGLWKRLWDTGIKGKTWRIVKELYQKMGASVRVGEKMTRWVDIKQGVRQGCPLSPVLFNVFVNDLTTRLKNKGVGLSLTEKVLHSLMYADDIVLLAASAQDLQTMINVVEEFCREWRMDMNMVKSEGMLIGENESEFAFALHYQGKPLPQVTSFKYLGIWINSKLTWDTHINHILSCTGGKSADLHRLLANNQIPTGAKAMIWKAIVRPNLEYGAEIWSGYLSATHKSRLRAIQQAAGVKIFKLNRHAKREAVNLLTNTQPLELRLSGFRLRYLARFFAREPDSLLRTVINKLPGKSKLKGPQPLLWLPKLINEIKTDAKLSAAYDKLIKYLSDHDDQLPKPPKKIHPKYPVPESTLRNPHYIWNTEVEDYLQRVAKGTVDLARGQPNSTLRVIGRLEGRSNLLRRPNCGIDQIKARLLCGTSALRATTHHYREGTSACPVCDDGREDTVHFINECEDAEMRKQRGMMESWLRICKCVPSCRSFLLGIGEDTLEDPEDKALFVLGGPTKSRSPCNAANLVFDRYLKDIWELRNRAEHPEEEILEEPESANPHSILFYFKPSSSLSSLSPVSSSLSSVSPPLPPTPPTPPTPPPAPEGFCSPYMDGDPRDLPMSST
jgi:exonuclease III